MYCPHCKKEVAGNDDSNKSGVPGFLGKHIVGLALLGLIITLMIIGCISCLDYLRWPKSQADYNLADSVRVAMLAAMKDEELMRNEEFESDLQALTTEFDITTSEIGENCILDYATNVLGVDDYTQLKKFVKYPGATKRIMVTVTGENEVRVRIEGAVYEGKEIMVE